MHSKDRWKKLLCITQLRCIETLISFYHLNFDWFANDFLFCIKFACQKRSFPAKIIVLRSKEIKPFQFHEKIPQLEYQFDGEYLVLATYSVAGKPNKASFEKT